MENKKFIIYQILLRVFGNRCESQVSQGSLAFNGTGKFSSVSRDVFAYLKRLGVTHIWYTGVIEHATCEDFTAYGIPLDNPLTVKGLAGSPYAIKDYYDVNPYLADNPHNRIGEFVSLVERTHEAGFKVIIDFVPNHLARVYHQDSTEARSILAEQGRPFPPDFGNENFYLLPDKLSCSNFLDSVPDVQKNLLQRYLNQRYSKSLVLEDLHDECLLDENPAKATGNNCFSAAPSSGDWYETVKLNYGVDYLGGTGNHFSPLPDTWVKMREILLFWLSLGVDGFRCDMAEMVPVEFWEWVTGEVRSKYQSALFIAEIYNRSLYEIYLFKGGFDYLYDKEGLYDHLKSIAQSCSVSACSGVHGGSRGGVNRGRVDNILHNDDARCCSGKVEGRDGVCKYDGECNGGCNGECDGECDGRCNNYEPQGRLYNIKASDITNCWQNINNIQNRMLNFLENHDEQRLASSFNLSNPFAAIPELVVSLMLNKAPFMLYFGQEVGERGMLEEGYSGKDGRTSIFDWCCAPSVVRLLNGKLLKDEKLLLNLYRTLIDFAMNSSAVTAGDMYDLSYCQGGVSCFDSGSQFVFARISRLDINNIKARKEVVIVAVDFRMKGVDEVYVNRHFMDYASLNDGGNYSAEWLVECDGEFVGKQSYIKEALCLRADSVVKMKQLGYGISVLRLFV